METDALEGGGRRGRGKQRRVGYKEKGKCGRERKSERQENEKDREVKGRKREISRSRGRERRREGRREREGKRALVDLPLAPPLPMTWRWYF